MILFGAVMAVVASLYLRVPLKVNVLRDRGSLVRDAGGGRIENVYQLQLINAAEHPRSFSISASGLPNLQVVLDGAHPVEVPAASTRIVPLRLQADPTGLQAGSHRIDFQVRADDDRAVAVDEKSVFFPVRKTRELAPIPLRPVREPWSGFSGRPAASIVLGS